MFDELKSKTVLLVEDERVIRDNLSSMLSIFFKKVYTAINGVDGVGKYQDNLPDIIITDLKMPHMNGYEMLKEIKKYPNDTFTIIISAHTDTDLLINAIHNKVDRYIIKPVTEDTLFEAFEAYIKKLDENSFKVDKLNENITLDLENSRIIKNKKQLHLNKKETLLLKLLTKNKNYTYSYEEIENSVWGGNIMSNSAIRSVVRDLRKKLGKDYLINISGIGYRFS